MDFSIKKMNESIAKEILLWKYNAPYDFYNNEMNDEGLEELLNGDYVAIVDESDQLVGFFCTGTSARVPAGYQYGAYSKVMIDIGLGMKPDLTGSGYGSEFFRFIIRIVRESLGEEMPLRVTVATFNKRAMWLYGKFGLTEGITFHSNDTEFSTMVKI